MKIMRPARAKRRALFPASNATDASPTRAPRRRVARLVVVADICPQVYLRVLGLLAQRDVVPLSMRFDHRPRSLRFEIDVEQHVAGQADIIAAKAGAIVSVRSVRWLKLWSS